MAKNTVYDDILKEYLEIRKGTLQKVENANAKIKDAKAVIEKNTKLMEQATKDGDLDTYAELRADNAKNEEIIKFFQGVIENAKHNSDASEENIQELNRKTATEKSRVREEYKKNFVKALAPAIEIAQEAYKQIYLLDLAENKITNNLTNGSEVLSVLGLGEVDFINQLDLLLQNSDYLNTPGAKNNMRKGENRNDWLRSAREAVEVEKKKWI